MKQILVNTTNSGSIRTITTHYPEMNLDYILKKSSFVRTAVIVFDYDETDSNQTSKTNAYGG